MINNKKVLAIIPARGGSKGIPKKNIIEIMGKPLIQYTLDEASKSKYIDEIHVSTDCIEVANVVKKLGYDIDRLRPRELAQDESKTIDVLIDVVTYYKQQNKDYEVIVLLQPTQPMRQVKDIDAALQCYIDKGEEGLVSVSEVEQHPVLIRRIDHYGKLENLIDNNSTVRRQDFEKCYIVNGAIYINSSEDILNSVSLNDNKVPYLMGKDYRNIDIDDLEDLYQFEMLLNKKKL